MLDLMMTILLRFWQLDMCAICGYMTDLGMITLNIKVICGSILLLVSTFHSVVSPLGCTSGTPVSFSENESEDGANIETYLPDVPIGKSAVSSSKTLYRVLI